MKFVLGALLILTVVACSSPYQLTVDEYRDASQDISLGMSMSQVDAILSPSQHRLNNIQIKTPDKYTENGVVVDIVYYRSGWQSDGLATDDEYTPYVFNDEKLVAIGWQVLGGSNSQGQARDIHTVIVN